MFFSEEIADRQVGGSVTRNEEDPARAARFDRGFEHDRYDASRRVPGGQKDSVRGEREPAGWREAPAAAQVVPSMPVVPPGRPDVTPRVLRWEDPPPSRGFGNAGGRPPSSAWRDVATMLRDEPGRWALVFEGDWTPAKSIKSTIAESRLACFRPFGAFEARMRTWQGVSRVYARHVDADLCMTISSARFDTALYAATLKTGNAETRTVTLAVLAELGVRVED